MFVYVCVFLVCVFFILGCGFFRVFFLVGGGGGVDSSSHFCHSIFELAVMV